MTHPTTIKSNKLICFGISIFVEILHIPDITNAMIYS